MQRIQLQDRSAKLGPAQVLCALDEALTAQGWVREGLDPHTLRSPVSASPTDDLLLDAEGAGAVALFRLDEPAGSAQVSDSSHTNENVEWVIGAGDNGFYLMQTRLDYPGGFLIERTPQGQWLLQYADNQRREGNATNMRLQFIGGNWSWGFYNQGLDGVLLQPDAEGDTRVLGRVSYLSLEFAEDNSGGMANTPQGPLVRGYWAHINGLEPVLPDLMRRYFPPGSFLESVEGGNVKLYQRYGLNGTFNTVLWRIQ